MPLSFEGLGSTREQESTKRKILQGARALRGAPRGVRDALLQIARLATADRRTRVITQDAPQEWMLLLGEGRVRVERRAGVEVLPLAHLGPGDLVGEVAVPPDAPACESAIVTDRVLAAAIRPSELHELARRDIGVHQVLAAAIHERARIAEQRLEGLVLRDVEARLAAFLLYAAERWGTPGAEGVVIATGLRHHEIAAMIGTGREWITMTLTRLRKRRVVGSFGRRIVLKNLGELERIAAGTSEGAG